MDGYRSTVIVELETDVGVRVALKKLLETTPLVSRFDVQKFERRVEG